MLLVIVRPRGDVAGRDPHPGDERVVKHDAEKGQAPIAGRGRDDTGEEQLAVGVVVLDQRTGPRWCLCRLPGPIPSGWSTSVKTAPKPLTVAGSGSIGAGHEEQALGDLAAYGGEQAQRTERAEDVAVGRIVEEPGQPPWGNAGSGEPAKGPSPGW